MRRALALLTLSLLVACGGSEPVAPESTAPAPPAPAPSSPPQPTAPRVVFLGDSLTAGYGVDEDQAFPSLLAKRLADEGAPAQVVNAGVSGDTSAGGLARLGWLLRQKPEVVVVELGANDGLRGMPVEATTENLRAIVRQAKDAGARVLLCGMLLPPSYGPDYTAAFAAIFPRLAEEEGVPLVPFLLDGVAAVPELNQADGIHPTPEGHVRVAETLLPYLVPLIAEVSGLPSAAASPSS